MATREGRWLSMAAMERRTGSYILRRRSFDACYLCQRTESAATARFWLDWGFRGPDLSAHWPLGTLIGPRAWSLVGVVLCEGLRARTIRVPNTSLSVFERDEGMPSTPRAMDKAVPSGAHKSRKMCMAQDRRRLRRTKRDHRPDVSCAIFCFLNTQFTRAT